MIAWPWGHCMGVVPGPGLIYLMVINGCLWSWECLCVNKGLGWSLGWLCVVSGTRPGGWGQNCPVKGTNKNECILPPAPVCRDCGGGEPVRAPNCRRAPHTFLCRCLLLFYVSGAAGSGGIPFMGKGVLPNGPAAPRLENHL